MKIDFLLYVMSTSVPKQNVKSLKERALLSQQVQSNFLKEIILTEDARNGILNMLIAEPHTLRNNREGERVASAMWKYSLRRYWCYNNYKDEFKDMVRVDGEDINIMDMLLNNGSFLKQVENQIRCDFHSIGYNKVIFRRISYDDRKTGYHVNDIKILVAV